MNKYMKFLKLAICVISIIDGIMMITNFAGIFNANLSVVDVLNYAIIYLFVPLVLIICIFIVHILSLPMNEEKVML